MREEGQTHRDRFNLTFILMFCLGTLAHVSGSIFPNAQLYWKYKLRDTEKPWHPSSNSTTDLQNEFTADFAIVGNATTIVVLVICIMYTRSWSITKRMMGCFVAYIFLFLATVIFVEIDTDSWQRGFLNVTLFSVFLISCVNTLFLLTVFQMCFKFSPVYISAILSGQSLCGIFSSLLQILTLSTDAKPQTNGFLYFSATVGFVVLVYISFVACLKYSPFFIHHLQKASPQEASKVKIPKQFVFDIWKRQRVVFIALLLIVGISSMVHPGITATVQSMGAGDGRKWNDTFFVPVITFFVYNCIDLLGREAALKVEKPQGGVPMLLLSFLRIALVPLLLFCNLTSKHHTSVVFNSDLIYIMIIILLAFSNGYLTNICVIMLPKNYDGTDKDRALTIAMLFFLLLLGSGVFSFLGLAILQMI